MTANVPWRPDHEPDQSDPEGIIRVLKFTAREPELLEDFLEEIRLFAEPVLADTYFESETECSTTLVIKIHSFKNDPGMFDTHILGQLPTYEGVWCSFKGNEAEPRQDTPDPKLA